jgi:trigger factor
MDVEVTRLPESRVALKIELAPQEVEQALHRTYTNLVQRVNIPGFRRGKAPRPVVERMVGRDLFLHEATDEAVRWAYRKAIDQEKLSPIDEAEIKPVEGEDDHLHPNEPFRFEATVTVRPDVRLPEYESLRVERTQAEVTDQDLDALLTDIRQRNATLEPTVRPAQLGDVVTMNIVARVGGEEALNDENFEYELRERDEESNPLLIGLSAELVGANRGDISEVGLPLAEGSLPEGEAGKTVLVRALIKEIKRKVLPDLDDEFAQSVSELQTLDELRAVLRENLEAERKLQADEKLVNDAIEAVTSRTFIEIPPALVEEELDRMMGDLRQQFQSSRLDFEQFLLTAGQSMEQIRNDMRETATRNVKQSLVLTALADAEGIEVSGGEVNASLEDLFRGASIPETERRRIRSSSAARASIRNRIRRRRAIQRLVEIVSGEDVSAEATDAVADQTTAADDTEENLAVEVAG